MLRAVIFDMDDTLLDWSQREGNWQELNQLHLGPIHAYLCETGHTMPDLPGLAEAYADQSRLAWETINLHDWDCPRQKDILRETLRVVKVEVEHVDMERVQHLFNWGLIPGVRAFDDSLEVLKVIQAAGIKTGLITNAALPMWMRDAELQAVGLLDHLDVRLTAGDVGKLKPHPQPFRVAMQRLGVAPSEAVFVGDRVQDDVAGAQLAGMRAIWVRRESSAFVNGNFKPNATVGALRELVKVLDLWYPGWRKTRSAAK
jgi:HAD superfamily hydrolase (TIGR01549 family)